MTREEFWKAFEQTKKDFPEYKDGDAARTKLHRVFYAQFVDTRIKEQVEKCFGLSGLLQAQEKDEHFNSIPLQKWDNLAASICLKAYTKAKRETLKEGWSNCFDVCVLKEAARQLLEEKVHPVPDFFPVWWPTGEKKVNGYYPGRVLSSRVYKGEAFADIFTHILTVSAPRTRKGTAEISVNLRK